MAVGTSRAVFCSFLLAFGCMDGLKVAIPDKSGIYLDLSHNSRISLFTPLSASSKLAAGLTEVLPACLHRPHSPSLSSDIALACTASIRI